MLCHIVWSHKLLFMFNSSKARNEWRNRHFLFQVYVVKIYSSSFDKVSYRAPWKCRSLKTVFIIIWVREWVLLSHLIRGHEEPWFLISGPYHPPSIFFIGHPQRLKCIGSTKDPYVNIGYRTREGNLIRSCFIICSVDQLYVAQPVHKVFKAIASLEETWSYWLTGSFHPFKIQHWSLLLSVK